MESAKNMKTYVREQLKHKNFKIIALETRRNGLEGLITRADLHSSEVAREQQMLALSSKLNKFATVAIDPDTGTYGIYQVLQPNGELPFEDETGQEGPISAESSALAKAEAIKLHAAGRAANDIAAKVVEARIRDYESLLEEIPNGVDKDIVLLQLRQAREPVMEVETTEGYFSMGGYTQLKDSLPCRQHYTVVVDIVTTEKGISHDPSITFVPTKDQPEGCSLPPMFRNHASICADISTSDKRTTLKFIHFSLFQEVNIKLELELDYKISTGRWSVKVVRIPDSKKAIENAKSAQMVFSDW
jgi:hypothetical protein